MPETIVLLKQKEKEELLKDDVLAQLEGSARDIAAGRIHRVR